MKIACNEEMDMIRGNLNRMCVTHDVQELEKEREWALKSIDKIYNVKLEILMQENAEKLDKISAEDRAKIYDVIDTMLRHSTQIKP